MTPAHSSSSLPPVFGEREYCVRCLRSKAVCLCSQVAVLTPSFRVVLLQHPHERRNTIGTARMTHLCLENSKLFVGTSFDADPAVNAILDDPSNSCVVLFPGPKSINISECAPEVRDAMLVKKNLVVFVIDGTWSHAKGMMRKSERLSALPQICFTPVKLSQYKVRKQPKDYCLSTVEAVHHLIGILDPETKADRLIEVFSHMVEMQVKYTVVKNVRELKREKKTTPAGVV